MDLIVKDIKDQLLSKANDQKISQVTKCSSFAKTCSCHEGFQCNFATIKESLFKGN